jgi:ribosomal protein L32E
MLLRLLEQNLDSEGEVIEDAFSIEEKQQIIKRAKELGIDITFEDL